MTVSIFCHLGFMVVGYRPEGCPRELATGWKVFKHLSPAELPCYIFQVIIHPNVTENDQMCLSSTVV